MMIDRRDFIASATLVFVAPAIHLLPSQQRSSAASQSRIVFMIRGWSVQDDRAGANQVWITVSNSWRTAMAMINRGRTRPVQQYSSF